MAGPGALFQIGCRRETIGRSACLEEGAPVSPGSTSSLRAFFELELRRTYAHPVAISQHVLADALAVYVDTVLAAPVNDARVVVFRDDYGVSPADVLSLDLNVVVHCASDSQLVLEQRETQFLAVDITDKETRHPVLLMVWRRAAVHRLGPPVGQVMHDVIGGFVILRC